MRIQDSFVIHPEGRRLEIQPKVRPAKTKVKVGKIYNCAIEGFSELVRAECLKIYEKSAHVRIIVCHKEQDEWRQKVLGDQTVVKLKNMILAK
ncbi:hypothetical protein ACFC67_11550 [Enterococcus gallinarum]|uniref:hypothetical protein n=1 Tax=Enterococcus gallinarum TaxID=1353 RepID=UPI0035D7D539